jgi:hypothetical protein
MMRMMRRQSSVLNWNRDGPLSVALFVLLGMFMHCAPGVAAQGSGAALPDDRQNADRLMVVDCLLPAQVHQLGTSVTYLAPRRAIKTTGSACAIRGVEYVAFDRANFATALKVGLVMCGEHVV